MSTTTLHHLKATNPRSAMKSRRLFVGYMTAAILLVLTIGVGSAPAVISVNFLGGTPTFSDGFFLWHFETAGVLDDPSNGGSGYANWNNAMGGTGDIADLNDHNGNPTGATLDWTNGQVWYANTQGRDDNHVLTGDEIMMEGHVEPTEGGSVPAEWELTGLASLFPDGYDLRIYHNTDSAGSFAWDVTDATGTDRRHGYQPTGQNNKETHIGPPAGVGCPPLPDSDCLRGQNYPLDGPNAHRGYIGSESTDPMFDTETNFVLFEGLMGDLLDIKGAMDPLGLQDTRPRPNGFQISPTEIIIDPFDDADFDQDFDVDGDDFLLWQTGFPTPSGAAKIDGDADGDGDVDGDDFLIWQTDFPSPGSGSASAAVPEPASIMLVLVALVGAVFHARRH